MDGDIANELIAIAQDLMTMDDIAKKSRRVTLAKPENGVRLTEAKIEEVEGGYEAEIKIHSWSTGKTVDKKLVSTNFTDLAEKIKIILDD